MKNNRFSVALHVLVHLVESGGPQTSEQLAACIGTNPVVVRRTMAGLREAGFVSSTRGTGGGWMLSVDPQLVTLRDVQAALGERLLHGIDLAAPRAAPGTCRIQRAVGDALDEFFDDVEVLLAERLGRISVFDLADRARVLPRAQPKKLERSNA